MIISVIVPTYNGALKLKGIIGALERQVFNKFELIIVVDGSIDNTVSMLNSIKTSLTSLRVIVQENKGRAAVRNKGAAEAKGELLIFLDDDMLPNEDCVKEHITHHRLFPNSALTGAAIDFQSASQTEIQKYKAFVARKWSNPLIETMGRPLERDKIFINAANFSIPKHLFNELGGFDNQLNDAEDYEFAVRAYKKGTPLYYNHNALAWHNDPINAIKYVRRLRQYRDAHIYLKKINPEAHKILGKHDPIFPKGIKAEIFNAFANEYWIKWIDQRSWKGLLPRSLRYLLFDLILTANGVYFPEKVKL